MDKYAIYTVTNRAGDTPDKSNTTVSKIKKNWALLGRHGQESEKNLYNIRKHVSTLQSLLAELKNGIHFKGDKDNLHRMIDKLGFIFKSVKEKSCTSVSGEIFIICPCLQWHF